MVMIGCVCKYHESGKSLVTKRCSESMSATATDRVRGNALRSGRPRDEGARSVKDIPVRLLPLPVPDGLVDLLLDRVEVERRRVLHRRIVDRGRRQLPDGLLNDHEAPEL